MKMQIEHKIREIADVLFRDMEAGRLDAEGVGVLAGKTGVIVFCEHFLRAFPDPAKEAVLERFLENYFEQLTSEVGMLTYCGGLTGALEGLRYLGCRGLLEVDCSDVENHYREVLRNFAMQGILSENYDYLHGGLGVVAYYLDDTPFVNRALEALERTAEKTGTAWKWVSSLGTDRGTGYNICLSHGMSSIVSVLSRADGAGIDRARRDRIVTGACEYILSQEIDPQRYGNFFPGQSLENDPEHPVYFSRLGWCYGDLGVAAALWQAGRALRNDRWCAKALEVLRGTSRRRELAPNGIFDAGLCHGAASVALMYHYMHGQTGETLFAETRDYWIGETLRMGRLEEGLAGYGAWHGVEYGGWKREYGLLEGIAGIGLMLLAALANDPKSDQWMRFFMLH